MRARPSLLGGPGRANRPGRTKRKAVALAAVTAILLPIAACGTSGGDPAVPRPDHIVVVVEENRSYSSIIGNSEAPYINELARWGASLTKFTAITHPSQPNYLALFSGSTQGVSDNSCPRTFTARNLASQLLQADLTFAGYSQSMPSVGFTGCNSGAYARRHNPWVNFSNVPASANLPWTSFPRNYADLPTVSFVIPDVENDMHDGTVRQADTWLRDNLGDYAHWAMTHNSLLVVTWDEDEDGDSKANQIPTVLVGEQVRPGAYAEPNNLYGLLRTFLDAYGLPRVGHAAEMDPIEIWRK
ncbi:alkaline phosphatase family protein [Streptomyces lunaelactis]|uniref:alkaline phosphatase family protein n=1 Tax=Streptomyces lunaelactis TaxID=1535768 RepID=UPI001585A785|nr:alkaline phosphatase family protein [Streptomyces lunaelactis]NUK04359.1 acid phosphatase [Streptomyces lunaelactis]NUK18811.1 acid phosphatase [Streptomyces lunaelactis]NUL04363.1 acid phosphatase [Streptomyces lunaelactis]